MNATVIKVVIRAEKTQEWWKNGCKDMPEDFATFKTKQWILPLRTLKSARIIRWKKSQKYGLSFCYLRWKINQYYSRKMLWRLQEGKNQTYLGKNSWQCDLIFCYLWSKINKYYHYNVIYVVVIKEGNNHQEWYTSENDERKVLKIRSEILLPLQKDRRMLKCCRQESRIFFCKSCLFISYPTHT